ncbi:alpha- and gamma-adaptin-binding protein p34-like [Pollicipes pollicipes]|uniref:alpha- and gamma-adaptin-binding protein p34-like n=1 Tax=Pollicipes pollicipes TaxID=41117 RepID=UPI001885919D|nr:alpha- and gamma-adaptin-binding protein p34-like [Pollicipes pollicipes]
MLPDTEPCVFIYGPESTVVNNIIHNMPGSSLDERSSSDLVVCYPWHVDNKYYTADVLLCHVQRKGLPDKNLADRCEAVVIYFNSDEANGLDEVDSILAFTKEFEPDVCILVCNTCHENTPVSRLRAQEWCVGHGFELVELSPSEEADPDDDFPETTGVQRITQALHAHTWSNLVMKDHRPEVSNRLLDELTEERPSAVPTAAAPAPTPADNRDTDAVDSLVSEMAAMVGPAAGAAGSDGVDDFEALFSQLAELRAAAARVPESQRHDYAERVAMAFLRSMGGDEDEPTADDSD